ncbi:ABC transporter ATP-binding protein [bacterium]|nr:ABC transporter ATP-binding protein [bacterium]
MNFDVLDREFFVILGPSGAGKTTTLKMIAGVESISKGDIYIGERLINDIPSENRNVAMVFESYALYSHLSVFKNIAFPLFSPKRKKYSKSDIEERVRKTAQLLSIDHLLHRKPSELSGGQRQRVALGRALVCQPDVFLMDEPISHLDAKKRNQMRSELKNLKDSIDATIIYVTHDYNEALALGDRIAILHRGVIQQIGTPHEVYHNPVNRIVAESFGDPPINLFEGQLVKTDGGIYFKKNIETSLIPTALEHRDRLVPHIGKKVYAGIRSQYVIPVKEKPEDFYIPGKVFVHEILGDDGILTVSVGEDLFMISTEPNIKYSLDEDIFLTWDVNRTHYFLKDTEENILI